MRPATKLLLLMGAGLVGGVFLVMHYYYGADSPILLRSQQRLGVQPDGDVLSEEEQVVFNRGQAGSMVIVKTREEKQAKLDSDDYIQSSLEEVFDYPALNSDTEDYVPLARGSGAKYFFEDRGKHLKQNKSQALLALARTTRLAPHERNTGVHLITTFFHGSYEDRRLSEIVAALVANLENPHIAFVHCLWEKENPVYYLGGAYSSLLSKLVLTQVKVQPTYARMFAYANQNLDRGAVVIVTNADIYFDASIKCVRGPDPNEPVPSDVRERAVYALSRRHSPLCGKKPDHGRVNDLCDEYVHSHDAFVFAVPVPQRILDKTNHVQNKYGAENIIVWEFTEAGFKVWNPCKKIHALHLHCSEERQYATVFIDGYDGKGVYRHGVVWPGTVRVDNTRHGLRSKPFVKCMTEIK